MGLVHTRKGSAMALRQATIDWQRTEQVFESLNGMDGRALSAISDARMDEQVPGKPGSPGFFDLVGEVVSGGNFVAEDLGNPETIRS